jgi:hypothetical protein
MGVFTQSVCWFTVADGLSQPRSLIREAQTLDGQWVTQQIEGWIGLGIANATLVG